MVLRVWGAVQIEVEDWDNVRAAMTAVKLTYEQQHQYHLDQEDGEQADRSMGTPAVDDDSLPRGAAPTTTPPHNEGGSLMDRQSFTPTEV